MPRITELFAWVATEADGDEGLPAVELLYEGRRMMMPLVGADITRVKSLMVHARGVREATNIPMRLCRFQLVEEINENDLDSVVVGPWPSRM